VTIKLIPCYEIIEEDGRTVIYESGFVDEFVVTFENTDGYISVMHMTTDQVTETYKIDVKALFEAMV
jgi:hypothetical protein